MCRQVTLAVAIFRMPDVAWVVTGEYLSVVCGLKIVPWAPSAWSSEVLVVAVHVSTLAAAVMVL